MKKKLGYSVLAIGLIAIVLFSYVQMSGNPVAKSRSQESLDEFMEQTYPDLNYEIERSADYGWTDATFLFTVVTEDTVGVETTYPFYVSAIEPYEILGDTIHASNVDQEASDKLNQEPEEYILSLLQERVPEIDGVSTDIEVYSGDDAEWTPQLKTPKSMLIMTGMDKDGLTKEQMLEQSMAIQEALNEEAIDYYMAEIGYRSVEGGEELYDYVSFTPEQELTIEDVD
ncbi:hypothetical protein [Alkalibacterium olivapovliticus]|uniref:Uncharacterized protein n=1 Tax=Alkalibacterium olivapovliticus TaxID=99907 RepID=A0A2T0VWA2_9LACT|nr:hypothetical protein [Alkalibacterium olivapovliticus]PRY76192.1 hypothetical protein CLV38_13223 [Alkalibacterium olivapovliticus]